MLTLPKKFGFNKDFKPCAVEINDELFPNGIFEFNITKLKAFINSNPDQFPLEEVDVKSLRWNSFSALDESTIQISNLSIPIILAEISPNRFNVIDGNHRLEKACRDKVKKLPAFRVYVDQHLAFLTSEKAYRLYVDYWNSKVDDVAKVSAPA